MARSTLHRVRRTQGYHLGVDNGKEIESVLPIDLDLADCDWLRRTLTRCLKLAPGYKLVNLPPEFEIGGVA